MTALTLLATRAIIWIADPTPSPAYDGDENLITPGVIGFVVTFLIAAATVLLLVDMVRRIRRVRYQSEVREKIAAEGDTAPKGTTAPED